MGGSAGRRTPPAGLEPRLLAYNPACWLRAAPPPLQVLYSTIFLPLPPNEHLVDVEVEEWHRTLSLCARKARLEALLARRGLRALAAGRALPRWRVRERSGELHTGVPLLAALI